jgi:hypothetical protein
MKKFISLLLCSLTCILYAAEKSSKESFFDTLNLIETMFHTNYAPAMWKKEYLGWELGLAMQAVEEEILAINNPSIIDYQKAFSHFFASPKDYHVSIRFYSTAFSSLPFRLEEVEGRYFIAWKDIFSNIKLQKGDEILEINHRPVSVVIREFAQEYLKESLTTTDCAIATAEFTFRQGRKAHTLPQGDISFLVTSKDTKKKFNYKMQWQHIPELFSSPFKAQKPTFTTLRALDSTEEKKAHNYFKKCLVAPLYTIQEESKKIFEGVSKIPTEIEKKGIPIGHRDSFIPPYKNIIWKSSTFSPFQAYIFKTDEDKKVGFLRIDSYMHETKSAEALLAIIEKMEAETEALIVDQTSNPGGILFFMYTVASTLTDKPLIVPKEHQPLTQEQLDFALCYQVLIYLAILLP